MESLHEIYNKVPGIVSQDTGVQQMVATIIVYERAFPFADII